METKEIVLKTLRKAKTAMKAGDIAEATGIDKKEVSKALKTLTGENLVHSPKVCFYASK